MTIKRLNFPNGERIPSGMEVTDFASRLMETRASDFTVVNPGN
ncbi:MAG TPA: hypothetical protein VG604_02545 [Candidatus Saccharimonadales bacterium]|nr:hypothetical protein [Candidatus Saccharimonadales bacterium]